MTTGPTQLAKAAVLYQRALVARVAEDHSPALAEWGDLIATTAPTTRRDDVTPVLAQRLASRRPRRPNHPPRRNRRGAVANGSRSGHSAPPQGFWAEDAAVRCATKAVTSLPP